MRKPSLQDLLESAVVVDVETTGLNPVVHSLLSVSMRPVVRDSKVPPLMLYTRSRTPRTPRIWEEWPKKNFAKFEREYFRGAMCPATVERRVLEFRRQFPEKLLAVGHNIGFDMAFLRAYFGHPFMDEVFQYWTVDTKSLEFAAAFRDGNADKLTGRDIGLGGSCERYGIEKGTSHTADSDTLATLQLLWKHLG